MVTHYRIEPGYNSGHDRSEVWAEIKKVMEAIRNNTSLIIDEVMQVEPTANRTRITALANWYQAPSVDLTCRVIDEEDSGYVFQVASGHGRERDAKESCRRAVCRIVLRELHKKQMEVSILVS